MKRYFDYKLLQDDINRKYIRLGLMKLEYIKTWTGGSAVEDEEIGLSALNWLDSISKEDEHGHYIDNAVLLDELKQRQEDFDTSFEKYKYKIFIGLSILKWMVKISSTQYDYSI